MKNGNLPWTRSCFVCGQDNPRGFRLRSRVEDDRVVLDYTSQPTDAGYKHTIHGGICMTLLDEVMTRQPADKVRCPARFRLRRRSRRDSAGDTELYRRGVATRSCGAR